MSPSLAAHEGLLCVPGFRAMGIPTGVKKGRPDLALIVSDVPGTTAAGVFTQNAFAGAPVHVCRQHVADGQAQAIIVNSGNANACTGRQGLRDALAMTEATAQALGLVKEQVLVCSTGIIGRPMPMDKILPGIPAVAQALDDAVGAEAAQAILTTDSGPKQGHRTFTVYGRTYSLAGIAKGAGMIHPNMATMLAFMVTDAPVPAPALRTALKTATDLSFNQISVDGDESTNDTALVLANGAAGGEPLEPGHPGWPLFLEQLTGLCQDLAKRIAADGEGATRLLTVTVDGAPDDLVARRMARAVVASDLVKSALHGQDPNWGRIVAAIGSLHVPIDGAQVDLSIHSKAGSTQVLEAGEPMPNLDAAHDIMGVAEVTFRIRVGTGTGSGTAWGCDLSEDYVTFNAEYST